MAEKQKPAAGTVPPDASGKPAGNPAFRMMGIPNFKLKLPSRNWLIFWTITGSFVSTLLYDRYHKRRAQQKWCHLVSHKAEEPLPTTTLPRRITIFLAAPPGDGLRAAREHFHEYIKPVLVAGAIDWEVIEGRREGEVRAGLAEKIRKLRRRREIAAAEKNSPESSEEVSKEDVLYELRQRSGTREWNGVQGDLILGRHTWKEYIRGLHEGWLGPLDEPKQPEEPDIDARPSEQPPDASSLDAPLDPIPNDAPSEESKSPNPPATKPTKPSPVPPYITPSAYSTCSTPQSLDTSLEPSLPLPLPHLLGFLNTPTRMYRFLTRRRLADYTGRSVAALVLAAQSRPYTQSAEFASAVDPDDASPSTAGDTTTDAVALAKETWEQEALLKQEEQEWHKSAWKANDEGDERERIWQEPMVIDSRIGERMRQLELANGEDESAVRIDEQKRLEADGLVERIKNFTGFDKKPRHGSEMGLEGDESD